MANKQNQEVAEIETVSNQEYIIQLLNSIKRDGIDKLCNYLIKSDFFTAPTSSRYHGAYEGGLAEHCINVYNSLTYLYDNLIETETLILPKISSDSIIIVSILHDMCKINTYHPGSRNVKDKITGQWESVPTFDREPLLPMGHAGKSVFMSQQFIKLSVEEALAIYWHMGAYDLSNYNTMNEIGQAYREQLLALLLHQADMTAAYILENKSYKPVD
jgi:hypothetical protein